MIRACAVLAIAAACSRALPCETLAADGSSGRASGVPVRSYANAAVACLRAFHHRGNASDGIAAARAFAAVQLDDGALAVARPLLSGPRRADAQQLIGRIYVARGHFTAARPLLEDALQAHRAHGDRSGAYRDAALLAAGYWTRSELDAALEMASAARDEAQASRDDRLYATSLIALGSVFQASGDPERAEHAYAQALDHLPRADRRGRAYLLTYRGALLIEQHQHALAQPHLEEARALASEAAVHELVQAAEINLSDVALRRGDLDGAARHLDAAERAWRAGGDPAPSFGILINRAILARTRGDAAGATRALDAAIAAHSEPARAWTIHYQRGLLAEAAHDGAAAERHHAAAIALIEELWRASSAGAIRATILEDRWQPYHRVFALRVARGAATNAFEIVHAAQGRMFAADALAATANRSPNDHAPRRGEMSALLASSTVVSSLGDPSPATTLAALRGHYALNYFATGDRMHLLILDRGAVRLSSLDLELTALDRLIHDALAHPEDAAAAHRLGDAVLPRDALAAAPARFHIIPAGPLLRVPFAALAPQGARVLDHHEVVYAPSASALAALLAAWSGNRREPRTVVIGDARGDLQHAAAELAAVAAATGAAPRVGAAATRDALRSARDATLLHVVGHSGVGMDGGYLVLADGTVTASEILTWQLQPQLVVLPTCASAATRRRDMWESLAVAFLAAGSRDVVATLFSVEDRVAAELTRRFYRHGGARDPVGALASAQRELAREEPAHAWWAFVVVGL